MGMTGTGAYALDNLIRCEVFWDSSRAGAKPSIDCVREKYDSGFLNASAPPMKDSHKKVQMAVGRKWPGMVCRTRTSDTRLYLSILSICKRGKLVFEYKTSWARDARANIYVSGLTKEILEEKMRQGFTNRHIRKNKKPNILGW